MVTVESMHTAWTPKLIRYRVSFNSEDVVHLSDTTVCAGFILRKKHLLLRAELARDIQTRTSVNSGVKVPLLRSNRYAYEVSDGFVEVYFGRGVAW